MADIQTEPVDLSQKGGGSNANVDAANDASSPDIIMLSDSDEEQQVPKRSIEDLNELTRQKKSLIRKLHEELRNEETKYILYKKIKLTQQLHSNGGSAFKPTGSQSTQLLNGDSVNSSRTDQSLLQSNKLGGVTTKHLQAPSASSSHLLTSSHQSILSSSQQSAHNQYHSATAAAAGAASSGVIPQKPKKTPASGYQLFTTEKLPQFASFPHRERMMAVGRLWNNLPETERMMYNRRADILMKSATQQQQLNTSAPTVTGGISTASGKTFFPRTASPSTTISSSPSSKMVASSSSPASAAAAGGNIRPSNIHHQPQHAAVKKPASPLPPSGPTLAELDERQAMAKMTLRKQLENTLLQIQPQKPASPELNFIPSLATGDFPFLLGLEEVVKSMLHQGIKAEVKYVFNPFTCVQCTTDFTPVWKRDKPGSKDVICEACVASNQKKAIRQDYKNRLKQAFFKALQQEQELDKLHQSQKRKITSLQQQQQHQNTAATASTGGSSASLSRNNSAQHLDEHQQQHLYHKSGRAPAAASAMGSTNPTTVFNKPISSGSTGGNSQSGAGGGTISQQHQQFLLDMIPRQHQQQSRRNIPTAGSGPPPLR